MIEKTPIFYEIPLVQIGKTCFVEPGPEHGHTAQVTHDLIEKNQRLKRVSRHIAFCTPDLNLWAGPIENHSFFNPDQLQRGFSHDTNFDFLLAMLLSDPKERGLLPRAAASPTVWGASGPVYGRIRDNTLARFNPTLRSELGAVVWVQNSDTSEQGLHLQAGVKPLDPELEIIWKQVSASGEDFISPEQAVEFLAKTSSFRGIWYAGLSAGTWRVTWQTAGQVRNSISLTQYADLMADAIILAGLDRKRFLQQATELLRTKYCLSEPTINLLLTTSNLGLRLIGDRQKLAETQAGLSLFVVGQRPPFGTVWQTPLETLSQAILYLPDPNGNLPLSSETNSVLESWRVIEGIAADLGISISYRLVTHTQYQQALTNRGYRPDAASDCMLPYQRQIRETVLESIADTPQDLAKTREHWSELISAGKIVPLAEALAPGDTRLPIIRPGEIDFYGRDNHELRERIAACMKPSKS